MRRHKPANRPLLTGKKEAGQCRVGLITLAKGKTKSGIKLLIVKLEKALLPIIVLDELAQTIALQRVEIFEGSTVNGNGTLPFYRGVVRGV